MISVHVNPALDWAAVGGAWGTFGFFWTGVLGRASVAVLSLISGYLLIGSLERKGSLALIGDRFRAIYLPMAFWNAVFLTSVLLATIVSAHLPNLPQPDLTPSHLILERIINLYGEPAVPALAFLRDLFISSVILVVGTRVLGRFLAYSVPLIIAVSLVGSLEPIIFRPNILLFMMVGAALRQHSFSLLVPRDWRPLLYIAFVFVVAFRFWVQEASVELTPVLDRLENLFLRGTLTLVALDLGALIARSTFRERLSLWEPHVFLVYLSHTTIISALWLLWEMAGGSADLPVYGAFFFLAHFAAFAAARLAAPIVELLPKGAQRAIRGKAV